MQPDIKKLITAFLGISLITSAISFSFLGSVGLGDVDRNTGEAAGSPRNAFADISLITPPWRTTVTPSSSVKDPFASSNLTENFSEVISHELLIAATITGEPNKIALNQAIQKIESRIFEESSSTTKIKINEQATLEDEVAYVKKVRDILEESSKGSLTEEIRSSKGNLEKFIAIQQRFAAQQNEILSLNTPAIFVPLQKTLLSFFDGNVKFLESLVGHEKDPVKTLLAIQKKEHVLQGRTVALTSELAKVESLIAKKHTPLKSSSLYEGLMFSLFLPQTAHAQQPTIDLAAIGQAIANGVRDAAEYAKTAARWIKEQYDSLQKWIQTQLEWAEKLATEQLKNVLVQLFVVQSIAWINGDGVPKFVTNWRTYADEAAVLGINKGFSQISSEACGTFGPTILENLNSSFNTYNMPSNCTRNSTGRMLENFRNNSFNEGGWTAYGAAISPRGNYFQSYTDYSARINQSADKEIKAAINEVIANDGFPSQKNCPESEAVPEQNSTPAEGQNQSQAPPTPLPDGSCADGTEPRATTPGVMFKAALDEATVAPIKRITSAENLINLAFNLANGALTKTRAQGSRGLTGLNNAASLNVDAAQTYDLADTCAGFTPGTPGHTSCLQSVGAAGSVQTDLDNRVGTDQVLQGLTSDAQIIAQNRNTINSVSITSLDLIQQLTVRAVDSIERSVFDRVVNACNNLNTSNPNRARLSEVTETKGDLQTLILKINELNSVSPDLLATDLALLSRSTDPVQLRNLFSQFTQTYGTVASTTALVTLAENRRAEIANIKTQSESNLTNSCATPIQRVTPSLLSNP